MSLGIDGGGSSTVACALSDAGTVRFERTVGATNPHTVPAATVADRLRELLDDCPDPAAVVACVAGILGAEGGDAYERCLHQRFPDAIIRLEPDSVAALECFDPPVAVVVIAGTGSRVCSRLASGEVVTSGGKGYLLGDHGSAFRLGQRLVARYVEDPESVDDLGPSIDAELGVPSARTIVATVHASATPAALLARTAPLLTGAADCGSAWARALVANEMGSLAARVRTHLDRCGLDAPGVRIGLVGGVWSSVAAREAFERALAATEITAATVHPAVRSPAVAAALLAREMARTAGR